MRGGRIGWLFLITLVVLALPAAALAHGGGDSHAGHAAPKPVAAAGGVTLQGYHVELLSRPSPVAAGQATQIVAKIVKDGTAEAVSGAKVLIDVAPAGAPPDPRPAPEVTWAGHYTVDFTAKKAGAFQARVAVSELAGRRLDPPAVVDFPVMVGPAPGLGGAVWLLIVGVAGLGALGLYVAGARARIGVPRGERLDLLQLPWLRRLLTSSLFQPALQLPMLAVTAVVVFLGFRDVQDGATNVATKLTWTIWWAGIIFTFVLVGRVWCLACPFGALNDWMSRLARPLRRLPRPFRNIWWATAMFVILTWADEQLGVVRSPLVTAAIVVFFAAMAVVIGLIYERRSFCRYLCPIGGLIGIYSMTAPLELRAKDGAVCRTDRDQECYRGGPVSQGCPMLEFPQTMDRNNYCTLCADCVKGCARHNLALRFRAFGADLWASRRHALDESYLAVMLVGLTVLVTAQMLTAWPGWMSAAARWLPSLVRTSLKPVTYLGLLESVVLLGGALVVGPLLVLAAAAVSNVVAGERAIGLRRTFVIFGYMFIPVGLAMHLAHNLSHLLMEGGGIVPAIQRAVALYTPLSLGAPDWQTGPLAPEPVVQFLQMAVMVALFVLSLVAGQRMSVRVYPDARTASRALAPMVLLSLAFTVVGIVLLNQPMGMRHGM